jgi:transposase
VIMREVVNGLMYVLSTGCQWRAIPKNLPPKSTVYDYFDLWTYDGTLQRIHHALYEQCREQAQREASPTAAIIDSQSVKSAEKDPMGRAARTMAPSSLQRINGAPHATAERIKATTLESVSQQIQGTEQWKSNGRAGDRRTISPAPSGCEPMRAQEEDLFAVLFVADHFHPVDGFAV